MLRVALRRVHTTNQATSLAEYKRALTFIKAKDYKAAEDEFHRCLNALDKMGLHADSSYNFVLTRIAAMQRSLYRFKDCEMTLEKVAKNFQSRAKEYPEHLSRAYTNLMMQYLQSNVLKGIMVGAAMQKEPYWSELTRESQKDIHFLFGVISPQTALILHGKDYSTAKKQLKTCLQKSPGPNSCFVLHNLACAQWWHASELTAKDHPDVRSISLDFTESLPNFRKAVSLFEGREGHFDLGKGEEPLKNPLTGLSLTNIAEMLFETGEWIVGCIQEAHKWLKLALDFYEKASRKDVGRTLMLMSAVLSHKGDIDQAIELAKSATEVLHGVTPTQRTDYNELASLHHYASLLTRSETRKSEAAGVESRAKDLVQRLPFWAVRAVHLHIPMWQVV